VTVAELIAVLQTLDQGARVVAPFSPNAGEINVEEVGGAFRRNEAPYAGDVELSRARPIHTEPSRSSREHEKEGPDAVSEEVLAVIRNADSDAAV